MPYIKSEIARSDLRPCAERFAENQGELNFQLTMIMLDYLSHNGLSYASINDIEGALVCAGKEFNRRVAVPYEDKKIAENGDVYPARFVS